MTSMDAFAERWRAPYLRSILDLQVSESADLYPEEGDTLDALWARVKKQATRYKITGRHFHLHRRADYIFVQRVEEGQRGKLAPYLRLAVGKKMLCTEPFETDRERKNLRRRLLHLFDRGHAIWLERHAGGTLYYRCIARCNDRGPVWSEHPTDDGSSFESADVVCCPFDLKPAQDEFRRIKAAIMASRASADAAGAILD